MIAMFLIPITVFADSDVPELTLSDETKQHEADYIENGGNPNADLDAPIDWKLVVGAENSIAPRYMCLNCNWFCYTVCAGEAYNAGTYTHSTLFTKDCKVTYFKSRGAMMCPYCYRAWEQYGYHDCWEAHTKCSKGQYDVCPMEIS